MGRQDTTISTPKHPEKLSVNKNKYALAQKQKTQINANKPATRF
jgi:hypothetical protein